MDTRSLYSSAYKCILSLATKEGINASGRDEIYGCIFGRDTAITVLKILRAHSKKPRPQLLKICRRSILTLVRLQGKKFNIETGEEPGKFIHEFRKNKYEHLVNSERPWYLYPDKTLKNYDSIDSTPLALIAIYRYWQISQDNEFLKKTLASVKYGLKWLTTLADKNKDFLVEYEFHPKRRFGGLVVQSWTDSHQSLIKKDGSFPKYPIAPIEAQGYAWLALKLWADFYREKTPVFSKKLERYAQELKRAFNKEFIIRSQGFLFGAQALDGEKKPINTITANPFLCLWAAHTQSGKPESIVEDLYIDDFVRRIFMPDMFVPEAGIRTMSSLEPTFNPNQDSYHNGSFWPVLNGMIIEALEIFGYQKEAEKLKEAACLPLKHFKNQQMELYTLGPRGYLEFQSPSGQTSCKEQAWTAASVLDWSTN